jgi:hypothetical protein
VSSADVLEANDLKFAGTADDVPEGTPPPEPGCGVSR